MEVNINGYFKNGIEKNKVKFKTKGKKTNNIIKYIVDDDTFTINLNKEKITFSKTNNNNKLKYIFDKKNINKSYYELKENNLKIYINVLTNSIEIKDNTIDINFMLENELSTLHIEYEVIK